MCLPDRPATGPSLYEPRARVNIVQRGMFCRLPRVTNSFLSGRDVTADVFSDSFSTYRGHVLRYVAGPPSVESCVARGFIFIHSLYISASHPSSYPCPTFIFISSYLTFIFKPHPTLHHCIYPHLTHRHIHVTCLLFISHVFIFIPPPHTSPHTLSSFTIHLSFLCLFLSHFSLSSAILG